TFTCVNRPGSGMSDPPIGLKPTPQPPRKSCVSECSACILVDVAPTPNFTLIASSCCQAADRLNWSVSVFCDDLIVRNVCVEMSGTSSTPLPLPCAFATLSRMPIEAVGTPLPQYAACQPEPAAATFMR